MPWAQEKPAPFERLDFFKLWMKFFFQKVCPPHCPGTVRPTAMKFGTMVDLVGMYEVLQGNWDRMIGE